MLCYAMWGAVSIISALCFYKRVREIDFQKVRKNHRRNIIMVNFNKSWWGTRRNISKTSQKTSIMEACYRKNLWLIKYYIKIWRGI